MSKICLGILCNKRTTLSALRNQIKSVVESAGFGCFFDFSYKEPLLNAYLLDNYVIFSIADNSTYDNCEMLLLPDGCMINGNENVCGFELRMKQMQDILKPILEIEAKIELFLGESGTQFDEFDEYEITLSDFLQITKQLNRIDSPDLHLILKK